VRTVAAYCAIGFVVVLLGILLTRFVWWCLLTLGLSLRELARPRR